jgi:hypothetical protein
MFFADQRTQTRIIELAHFESRVRPITMDEKGLDGGAIFDRRGVTDATMGEVLPRFEEIIIIAAIAKIFADGRVRRFLAIIRRKGALMAEDPRRMGGIPCGVRREEKADIQRAFFDRDEKVLAILIAIARAKRGIFFIEPPTFLKIRSWIESGNLFAGRFRFVKAGVLDETSPSSKRKPLSCPHKNTARNSSPAPGAKGSRSRRRLGPFPEAYPRRPNRKSHPPRFLRFLNRECH